MQRRRILTESSKPKGRWKTLMQVQTLPRSQTTQMKYYAFQTKDGRWHYSTGHTRRSALGRLRFFFHMQARPDITFAGPWRLLRVCPGPGDWLDWPDFHNDPKP